MLKRYFVNPVPQSPNGEHEVHAEGCAFMPYDPIYLGMFFNCEDAVKAARAYYSNVDGCYFCCNHCHTK